MEKNSENLFSIGKLSLSSFLSLLHFYRLLLCARTLHINYVIIPTRARDPSPSSLKRANRLYASDTDVSDVRLCLAGAPLAVSFFIHKSRVHVVCMYVFYNTTQENTVCSETGFQSAYFNQIYFVGKKYLLNEILFN